MVFMSKTYVHTMINIRELLAAAPALPGVYETPNFREKQDGNVQAPNLSPCTKLKAEKFKFCWVKPRAKPGRALQGPSSATRGCQEASVACVWQSLTKIHPCLVLGARVGGTGDAPPWPAPGPRAAWLGQCGAGQGLGACLPSLPLLGSLAKQR